jgi:hypothetical protein
MNNFDRHILPLYISPKNQKCLPPATPAKPTWGLWTEGRNYEDLHESLLVRISSTRTTIVPCVIGGLSQFLAHNATNSSCMMIDWVDWKLRSSKYFSMHFTCGHLFHADNHCIRWQRLTCLFSGEETKKLSRDWTICARPSNLMAFWG